MPDNIPSKEYQSLAERILNAVTVVDSPSPDKVIGIQFKSKEWALIAKAVLDAAAPDTVWQDRYNRDVLGQNNEGDLIGGGPGGLRYENEQLASKLNLFTNALQDAVALMDNIRGTLRQKGALTRSAEEESIHGLVQKFLQFNDYFKRKPGEPIELIDWQGKFKTAEYTLLQIRSWPEDFEHENGNYECICADCTNHFIGHKRRVLCRVCVEFGQPRPPNAVRTMPKTVITDDDRKQAAQRKNTTFGLTIGPVSGHCTGEQFQNETGPDK